MKTAVKAILIAIIGFGLLGDAFAAGKVHRRKILIPITSPSLTAVARDATQSASWTTTASTIAGTPEYQPPLRGTILRMFANAPDFATTATTYTISIFTMPDELPTTTTGVLSENCMSVINTEWPGIPMTGYMRFRYNCTTANTTDVVQLLSVDVEYADGP